MCTSPEDITGAVNEWYTEKLRADAVWRNEWVKAKLKQGLWIPCPGSARLIETKNKIFKNKMFK